MEIVTSKCFICCFCISMGEIISVSFFLFKDFAAFYIGARATVDFIEENEFGLQNCY